jgi:hypothetical protein
MAKAVEHFCGLLPDWMGSRKAISKRSDIDDHFTDHRVLMLVCANHLLTDTSDSGHSTISSLRKMSDWPPEPDMSDLAQARWRWLPLLGPCQVVRRTKPIRRYGRD